MIKRGGGAKKCPKLRDFIYGRPLKHFPYNFLACLNGDHREAKLVHEVFYQRFVTLSDQYITLVIVDRWLLFGDISFLF